MSQIYFKLANILKNMSVNFRGFTINVFQIVDEGALPLFLKMLQHDDVREQSSAARIIWTLSFDKDVRQKIKDFPELVPILEKLTESTNKSLQNNASGALWVIRGDNDVTKESSKYFTLYSIITPFDAFEISCI